MLFEFDYIVDFDMCLLELFWTLGLIFGLFRDFGLDRENVKAVEEKGMLYGSIFP